ncbi:AAA family ATPase [Enterococcus sp. BWR-S5]|uniref:AAA family ATPase n=1 Tax=Enterococcus sp. BWR-S5 TaxID=2787714 RepID=UPI0019230691|nr:AAA family ATPase [Enterococcus sp. BWR-S5]MBL1225598.1 AAA family ATPase [Enterococcus sp. BWR-S5]
MRNKLTGTNIGVFFGTWAPMHIGHISAVHQAKRLCDGVILAVSGYDGDRGDQIGLSLEKRFRYTRETFKEDELIAVDKIDETAIPRYPQGWLPWLEMLETVISKNCEASEMTITIFVGEKEYVEKLNELRPTWKVVLIDRQLLPISATLIRENPLKYWQKIARPFRRHFSKNILIAGSASGGKTTLVKDLARSYGSPFSLEYARHYQQKYNVLDEELNAKDYVYLLANQYRQTSNEIEGTANNGLVFADTNSTVTKAYMDWYLTADEQEAQSKEKTLVQKEEFEALNRQYAATVQQEKWDIIFIVPPVTKYVDDHFRDMTMAEENIRWAFHEHLLRLFEEAGLGDKVVLLETEMTSADPQGFYSRYQLAQDKIAEILDITVW